MQISETNVMADFEREVYVNLLLRDIREEAKSYEGK